MKRISYLLLGLLLLTLGALPFFLTELPPTPPVELAVRRSEGALPFVEVTLGEEKKWALFDLGAISTSIDQETIEKGLALPTGEKATIFSSFGEEEEEFHLLKELSIGPYRYEEVLCRPPHILQCLNSQSEGLWEHESVGLSPIVLGVDLFEKLIVLIDLKRDKIFLFSSKEELLKSPYRAHTLYDLQAEFKKQMILVPLDYEGTSAPFLLDSGSSVNFLIKTKAEETEPNYLDLLPEERAPALSFERGLKGFYETNMLKSAEEFVGILGIPFFEESLLLIDFPQKELFLLKEEG